MDKFLFIGFFLLLSSCHYLDPDYKFSGRHFIASYQGCDKEAIRNLVGTAKSMEEAVIASGATVLNSTFHPFPPDGLTVIYLLSESHASLHTYPEHRSCFVDLFTCGDHCLSEKFDVALRTYLKPTKVNAKLFLRDKQIKELIYPVKAPE